MSRISGRPNHAWNARRSHPPAGIPRECRVSAGILCSPPLQKLTLRHLNSNQCLAEPSDEDRLVPTMRECAGGRSQQWLLRNMTLGA